ncbi:head-tail connector protein [Aliidiomarina sp. Khilg15.8]
MVTLQEIKRQCRIEMDFNEDDEYLESLIPVATGYVSDDLQREIYETQEAKELAEDDEGIVVDARIKHALLMVIHDFYENRSSSSTLTLKDNPAYDKLISRHRLIHL